MNFEKLTSMNNAEEVPETKNIDKGIEKRKEVPPYVKYILIAVAGYMAGKNAERNFDQASEIIDAFKQKNSIVENNTDTDPDFVNRVDVSPEWEVKSDVVDSDLKYQESLKLVDEILARENPELSPENLEKLELMRGALSESLKLLDDVLSDTEGNNS